MTPDRERFGRWLKENRERAQLTQEGLAEKIGKKKAYISKLETAKKHSTTDVPPMPTLDTLHDLSEALRVPMTEPLKAYGYVTNSGLLLDEHEESVVKQLRQLTVSERELFLDFLQLTAGRKAAPTHSAKKPRTGTDN